MEEPLAIVNTYILVSQAVGRDAEKILGQQVTHLVKDTSDRELGPRLSGASFSHFRSGAAVLCVSAFCACVSPSLPLDALPPVFQPQSKRKKKKDYGGLMQPPSPGDNPGDKEKN